MKYLISICWLFIFNMNSIWAQVNTTLEESWNGVFLIKDQGQEQVNLHFIFNDSTGTLAMPNLIPVPLEIIGLKKEGDSLFFFIHFRSGTASASGKYIYPDSIKGTYTRADYITCLFYLFRSSISNSIFNLPKPPANEPFVIEVKTIR